MTRVTVQHHRYVSSEGHQWGGAVRTWVAQERRALMPFPTPPHATAIPPLPWWGASCQLLLTNPMQWVSGDCQWWHLSQGSRHLPTNSYLFRCVLSPLSELATDEVSYEWVSMLSIFRREGSSRTNGSSSSSVYKRDRNNIAGQPCYIQPCNALM